ncbi:hypothetical protein P280DRAFT_484311 [Massarina eburnea CBS 473.64]|uniref:Uncharacterized protein n=1 Tax=Massarina eburnea CBS 473.64 TaxID=1395130 RepID=A0A6A6RMK4_9PLEO|nr:hypothetical protein P280DRAFT_484311 [Massarina eburnea CBS 473.64]
MSLPSPIEAKSLSSLTALASNPPSYPRNPTHGKQDPLVLYIARVPGSRDIFLSPIKPRDRVVTAEDIETSLYFVHMDHPEDSLLVDYAPTAFPRDPNYDHQLPAIQRKAIPSVPGAPLPQRKPMPGTLAPVNGFDSRQNIAAAGYAHSGSEHLGPDYTPRRSFDSMQLQSENQRPSISSRASADQPRPPGTSLTLIRRDPASGAQWNVARINDPLSLDMSSSTLNAPNKRPIGAPMYIDVLNPGYSKFLHTGLERPPALHNRDPELFVDPNAPQPNAPKPHDERVSNIFRRRLWMEGANDPRGGFGHRKLNSHDSSMSNGSPRSSIEGMQRSSADLRPIPTSPLSRDSQSYSTIPTSERQTSFRGYVFMSPWNGRCEFTTGAGGGSLKCRHIVPGLQGAPPVSLPVSELRFNLPAATKASTPRGEESKRSSIFHRPRHSRHNSSVSDTRGYSSAQEVMGAFERMDLTLGQEYAGGGFGGKDAKLGKLIVEDEGLKMVDLLVAANVALWWRAYDRYDTRVKTNR